VSEHAHRTFAVPETATYPAPPASIMGVSLHAAILSLDDRLQAATEEYAAASANLAEAVIAEAEAREMHEAFVTRRRAEAHAAGLRGSNEAARQAALAELLRTDGDIALGANHLEELRDDRLTAEHNFRVVDQCQKSLRVRLEALSGLVRGGGA
jgi:hypothetical protein